MGVPLTDLTLLDIATWVDETGGIIPPGELDFATVRSQASFGLMDPTYYEDGQGKSFGEYRNYPVGMTMTKGLGIAIQIFDNTVTPLYNINFSANLTATLYDLNTSTPTFLGTVNSNKVSGVSTSSTTNLLPGSNGDSCVAGFIGFFSDNFPEFYTWLMVDKVRLLAEYNTKNIRVTLSEPSGRDFCIVKYEYYDTSITTAPDGRLVMPAEPHNIISSAIPVPGAPVSLDFYL